MFVCLDFYVPLENFSLTQRPHHNQGKASLNLYSALMAIEQWGFFGVPHLLWHGPTLYKDHLWRPVTLTPVAKHLALELSLTVFWRLKSVPNGDRTLISPILGESSTSTLLQGYRDILPYTHICMLRYTYFHYCLIIRCEPSNLTVPSHLPTSIQISFLCPGSYV